MACAAIWGIDLLVSLIIVVSAALPCLRQGTRGLYFAIVLEEKSNGFAKRYSIAEVFRQLELSDDDCFDDNDSDRDSDKELDDVERISDVDSEATEDYNAQTGSNISDF